MNQLDFRTAILGLLFALCWSSAFSSARIIVLNAPPLSALALRFAVSGLIAVGIAAMIGQSARLSKAQWRATVVFGICQNALYLGANFVAMQWIEASMAAIIASTLPLIVAVLNRALFKVRISALGVFGLIAGFLRCRLNHGKPINRQSGFGRHFDLRRGARQLWRSPH